MVMETFLDYINEKDTDSTKVFKVLFKDTLNLLPTRVCSSKQIWIILKNNTDIDKNIFKTRIFRECFMEYFKWKITKDNFVDYPIR